MSEPLEDQKVNTSKQFIFDLNDKQGTPFSALVVDPASVEVSEETTTVVEETPIEETPTVEETPVEEETEVVEVEETSEEEEEVQPPNHYYFMAKQMQLEGELPSDLEIEETVDFREVYDKYKNSIKPRAEEDIRNEVYNKLRAEGVSQETLTLARAIEDNVDINLLSQSSMHKTYSQLAPEASQEEKLESIRQMYIARKFSDTERDNLIKNATDNDQLDELFETSTNYHKNEWNTFEAAEKQRAREQDLLAKQAEEQANAFVRGVLTKKEVYGEKFSEEIANELKDAFYVANASFEHQGQNYRMTEFEKFTYEYQLNPELKLWLFKKYKFRDKEEHEIKEEVKKEVEAEFLSGYETAVQKSKKATKKVVKKEEEEPRKPAKSFLVDLSAM